MFIGHFAAGLAGKRAAPRASLGTYVAAALFLDLLWPVFLILGVEQVRIAPGITALSPFDFVSYPWSHSWLMAILWSFVFGGVYYVFRKDGATAKMLGFVVFSHWVLDWVTHRPDLQLIPGLSFRTGLGLWSSIPATIVIEGAMFLAAAWWYRRGTNALGATGRWAWYTFVGALLIAYAASIASSPKPGQERALAYGAFATFLFIPWAMWVEGDTPLFLSKLLGYRFATKKGSVPFLVSISFLGAAFAADAIPVKVTTDMSGSSTRVVLTFAAKAGCTVAQETGRIKVGCDAAIRPDPASAAPDDAILTRIAAEGDRALVLFTGRGFTRLDTFELKNPMRLVLDLSGTRAGRTAAPAVPAKVLPVIVLDPGHGGVETGAVGPSGLQEKDLTLDLARRLKTLLERQGVTVVLTRDDDRVLPLDDRTAIANHNRAILFISLHLNASKRKTAVGAETYFLSTSATDAEARTLAGLENKAYAPADAAAAPTPETAPDRGLELILWDLAQNSFIAESSRLAEATQKELNTLTGVRDRGVRQAPFRVLMGATMPAILIEAGFISSPEEEARFKDDAYKEKIAEAIARAVGSVVHP